MWITEGILNLVSARKVHPAVAGVFALFVAALLYRSVRELGGA